MWNNEITIMGMTLEVTYFAQDDHLCGDKLSSCGIHTGDALYGFPVPEYRAASLRHLNTWPTH